MIVIWPHIMHNCILDFQLYSQRDEESLGNYPLHCFLLYSALDCPICIEFVNFLSEDYQRWCNAKALTDHRKSADASVSLNKKYNMPFPASKKEVRDHWSSIIIILSLFFFFWLLYFPLSP